MAAGTPDPEPTPPFDSRRMKEEFARIEEQLGTEKFTEILAPHGIRSVSTIRSLALARRIYREMLAEQKASANREANNHVLHDQSDLPVSHSLRNRRGAWAADRRQPSRVRMT